MKLFFHYHYRPCNDVVFSIMFGKRNLFSKLCSAVTNETVEVEGEPFSQATLRENDALLNAIRFDTFAYAKNNKLYTMDIQRRYKHASQKRRAIYYMCRSISTQQVKKMEYEKLKPVNISFLFVDNNKECSVKKVMLCDLETKEVYDDLIELTLVYVPAVIRTHSKTEHLYIFACFFMISSQEEAEKFVKDFGTIELGKELISLYNEVIANAAKLQQAEKLPYFTERLTEAELEEARQIARQEARQETWQEAWQEAWQVATQETKNENARNLLKAGVDPNIISQSLGINIETVNSL